MSKKINIGIIGCGGITIEYLKVFKLFRSFKIQGITSKTNKNCERIATKYKIKKIYKNYIEMAQDNKIDAIFILVSYKSIYEVSSSVMKYSKPLFIEKPPGLSLKETKKLSILAKKYKIKNMVGFNRRFYSIFEKGLNIISAKGKLLGLSIEGHERAWNKKFDLSKWLFANSIHTLDLVDYFGGKIKSKKSYVKRYKKLQSNIVCNFKFFSGTIGTYHSFWYSPGGWSVKLYGEGVTVVFKPLEKGYYYNNLSSQKKIIKPNNYDLKYKPGFYKQLKIFENYLLNNKKDIKMHDLQSCLKTIKLINAISNIKS